MDEESLRTAIFWCGFVMGIISTLFCIWIKDELDNHMTEVEERGEISEKSDEFDEDYPYLETSWCGQMQPHPPHQWAKGHMGLLTHCSGHS